MSKADANRPPCFLADFRVACGAVSAPAMNGPSWTCPSGHQIEALACEVDVELDFEYADSENVARFGSAMATGQRGCRGRNPNSASKNSIDEV